ncbi:MAG: heme-binding domain-containing protein [Saprospiraceae bacterium]|nr:heme-binding domain-containing protein [Bacteroidia bacterium]NNF20541.1 heme-binding domain-containing protein [Saprospiraceae bacterium]NNK90606.1 heme-binding domain-containing protein [Saprospiraceae bacterium]
MTKKVLLAALAILVIIQVFSIDKTNPPVDESIDFFSTTQIPGDVMGLLKHACADCHSYKTKYPWYTNIEPVSWWIKGHIDHGRGNLNFSEWGDYSKEDQVHFIRECIEVIEEKRMPLTIYALSHKEARLSDSDRQKMVEFFRNL